MKSDNSKLQKSIKSLAQASAYLNDVVGENIDEAKNHINQAIKKIQKQNKKINLRKDQKSLNELWWTNIVAGTSKFAEANHTIETQIKTLNQLQSMIDTEQKNLDNLENNVNNPIKTDDLLNG